MRHLLAGLVVLITLTLAGPALVSAQDATPEAGAGTAAVARTDVRYLLPFGPDGLNAGLTEAATVEGVCGFASIVALDRPDAWDCISAESEIFDPCFEPLMMDPEALGQLACLESPFSTEVTLLTLTEPLVREKEVPAMEPSAGPGSGPGTGPGPSTGAGPGPSTGVGPGMDQGAPGEGLTAWDLPWALELANGDQCTLLHGTLTVQAGQTVHYGCSEGGMVLGEVDHRHPVWTVNYLAEGESASRLVDVVVAWS
jgi:hypothetical protein